MKTLILLSSCAVLLFTENVSAQRLDPFLSETGKLQGRGEQMESLAYPHVAGYYDYLDADQLADTVIAGNPYHFLYFRIPFDVSEIGIRMFSPVPANVFADVGDFETPAFESNRKNNLFFDPSIVLEQWQVLPDDSTGKTRSGWKAIGKNDNSTELLSQPSGKFNNALLRIHSGPYPSGIYRLRFADLKNKVPEGTFLLQFGTIPGIKRLKVRETQAGLDVE